MSDNSLGALRGLRDVRVDRLVRQGLDKVALPIPLQALRKERVKQRLHRRERHRTHPVEDGRRHGLEQSRHDLFTLLRGAVVTGNHSTGAPAPVVLRKRVHGWHRLEADEGTQFLGGGRQEIAIGAHHGPGVSSLPEDRACVDRTDRMCLEQEARHHAKVATSAAQRPEEIGVLAFAGSDKTAVGQDNVRFEQVIDGEAVLACEVPGAPADGEARDAGGRDDAKWHGQSERVGGMIDIAGRAASINPNGSACRIYAHAFHHREVDHQSVVATAKARATVAASTDGDQAGPGRGRSSPRR